MSENTKSGDWSYCPACGGEIDTGYECGKCGRDWLEWHQTHAALRAKLEASEQECVSWRTVLNHEREAAQKKLEAMKEERDGYARRIAEQDAEYYLMVEQLEELKQQFTDSEQRVREVEAQHDHLRSLNRLLRDRHDLPITRLHEYMDVEQKLNQLAELQATITAQQEEIVRLRAACQVSKVGAINASCGHSSYWVTAYGNCMACRAEQAEKRLEALASGKEAT